MLIIIGVVNARRIWVNDCWYYCCIISVTWRLVGDRLEVGRVFEEGVEGWRDLKWGNLLRLDQIDDCRWTNSRLFGQN